MHMNGGDSADLAEKLKVVLNLNNNDDKVFKAQGQFNYAVVPVNCFAK
jgi:hypothetical protein